MRAENLLKCEVTSFFCHLDDGAFAVNDMEAENVDRIVKQNYELALAEVLRFQKSNKSNLPGYILHSDIVYKVTPTTGVVNKITGTEAKSVKKQLRDIAENMITMRNGTT